MRAFAAFVALLAGSLILAAALTYPAWLLVGTVSIEPVHRVMHRVAMLIALIGLVVLTRRLGLSNRAALGYGLPRAVFIRQLVLGWLCGLGLMLPLVGLLLGLDVREPKAPFDVGLFDAGLFEAGAGDANLLVLAGSGILAGLVVAFIEETFFRGVMVTAVRRTSGTLAAVVAPALLYASLHFLGGRLRVPADEVSWIHGFAVLAHLFERYQQPLVFADSFAALAMLGVLLALVRLRTGAIAACIGLHAAGVAVIAVLRETTVVNAQADYAGIVGRYDGVIGWAALIWFTLIVAWYALQGRRRGRQASAERLGFLRPGSGHFWRRLD